MPQKEILCAFKIDVDAAAGWLGSYGGEDSPDDISRGMFAGEVGSPRLLNLFEKYGLRTTWFIPGHSIETFPEQMKMVVDGGHELVTHGYSHENPVSMTPQQEKDVIDKCVGLVEDLTGKKPAGNSAPWWEPSDATNEILLEYGYKYDRSLQHNDFTPYWARKGDQWTPIDYSQPASEWMKPLVRGEEIDLLKIPLFPRASPPSAFAYTPPMEQTSWNTGIVPGDVKLAFGRVGEGPEPVLALHGITAQHRTFNATARYIEHQSGMVALDLRGRGDSGKPSPGNYGLGRHARDAIRTLDYLGVERCVLVGHSMGAFVALHTALLYPDRVRGLVLLDGGWPRPEEEPDEEEAAAIAEGLERAYRRLDMVFETPNDYLDFWFPGQNLTLGDLPPDLADYYLYDLEKVDGGYTPKASREAAEEDGDSVSSESPTAEALRGIVCPVALVRAEEGFFPDSRPLISDETRDVIAGALDLCLEHRLQGANHYTMMFFEFARQVAAAIDDLLRRIR